MNKQYLLKSKDNIIAKFDFVYEKTLSAKGEAVYTGEIKNTEILNLDMLPLAFNKNIGLDKAMENWIEKRKAPSNRQFIEKIRQTYKDDSLMSTVNISFGLSLNDTYWIIPSNKELKWKDYNLYNNKFDNALELVAFLGYTHKVGGFTSSPEYTTNGMLKKAWHRDEYNNIELLKGCGTSYANGGKEAYAEYYMAQIANLLGFKHINYDLKKFHKKLVSSCRLFTDENRGYMPIYYLIENKALYDNGKINLKEIEKIYGKENFEDLMLFDAIIYNKDRHLGNFGMLIDNSTNKILETAPIFDNGFSLINSLTKDDLKDIKEAVKSYKSYFNISFDEQLKIYAKKRHIKNLAKLTDFSFKRHKLYNLDEIWLTTIEKHIRERSIKTIKNIESSKKSINLPYGTKLDEIKAKISNDKFNSDDKKVEDIFTDIENSLKEIQTLSSEFNDILSDKGSKTDTKNQSNLRRQK